MFMDAYGPQAGYCNPMSDYLLAADIEEYIHDELKDSRYYSLLATKAPTQRARDLLMEFSRDEQGHAENFMRAYFMLTGRMYTLQAMEPIEVPDYREALKVRILAETHDYRKYGEKYLIACNRCLKDLFYMTRTVEAQHAMRIPLLMDE